MVLRLWGSVTTEGIDDVIINNVIEFRYHVAMDVYISCNRSRKTPKCCNNFSDTFGWASCVTFLLLPYFDVGLLLDRHTETRNLFVKQPCLLGVDGVSKWHR